MAFDSTMAPPDMMQAALLNGGVLPPTNPIQPAPVQPGTGQDPLAAQALQGMQQGQQAFGQQLERQRNLADTVSQLQQQQAQMQLPKMGYQPKFQPMDSAGHALGDIGKGLLLALASTGPGRAIQGGIYGPGIRQYEAKYGALGERIKELQSQQQIEEQPMGSAASIAVKPFSGYGSYMRGEASMMNAQTQRVAEQHKNAIQMRANEIRQQLGSGKLTQEQARTEMMKYLGDEHNAMMRDVAAVTTDRATQVEQMRAAEEDFKTESDHWLQNLFGQAPEKPVTPAAGTPRSAKGGNVPAGTIVYDPNGKAHRADGTAPLPPNWSMSPKTKK